MKSRDELLQVLDGVCADVRDSAIGEEEVAERIVLVASSDGTVDAATGTSTHRAGDVVAFVNDSGVPFVEQSDDLISQVASLQPEAVLLAGSALTGRPGAAFQKVLAVQLFSVIYDIRMARIASVEETNGVISAVAPWKDVKAGPRVWAERLLRPNTK
ncbi:hypothetical protein [Catenulispora rubra]|uniref:hypothetical protein n=1 Tax=Catenulispora rubra TaxID=280293 RepID=UPI0018925C19|nr:hypothetical protein [Catenulispora rubra]